MSPKTIHLSNTLFSLIVIIMLVVGLSLPQLRASAASTVAVNAAVTYQVIDGFGASDAFRAGAYVRGDSSHLTAAQSAQIVQLLFSPTAGAGFSIIRHEIGSSTAMVTGVPPGGDGDNLASIEPNSPGGPNVTPTYVWNTADPDSGQIWFTQQAQSYNPAITVYADAWSSPAYMKTNNLLTGGGFLCGAVGAPTCASGDWRQAYANYLTQYATFYKNAGINLAYIGYTNEPELSPSYAGMNWDATNVSGNRGTVNAAMPQDIDFIKNYLGPTLAASGLTTKVLCCDATSWANAAVYASGILADPTAANYLGLVTGHGYYSSPNGVITTPINAGSKHVWETETATFDTFSSAWDDGSDASGIQWAQNIWNGLVNAKANAFLYWWFAQRDASNADNEDLIHMYDTTYTVTKRLWAFANYSRFIRPGATRIDATSANTNLKITAAKNTDGSFAIVVLNTATADEPVTFTLSGGNFAATVTPYLTNASNDMAQQPAISAAGGNFTATVPARSLVTYSILDGGPTPTPCASCSPTPTRTNTPTVTPTATICLSCTLRVQYQAGDTAASSTQPKPQLKIFNTSSASIPLSALKIRYWYTIDGVKPQTYNCDYAVVGCGNITGIFGTLTTPTSTADTYLELSFAPAAGSIAAGGNSGEIQNRINKTDWSAYTQTNDYSFDATKTAYADWNNVTLYYNGTLVWGVEPGGVVGPSATPTLTPAITSTPTRTATASNTPTGTMTPIGPTATPTRTATASNTPTGTMTPIGPTVTPTRTATASNTPVASTPTPTATPGAGACSPVTSSITAPFTFDGAGTFCWQASSLGSYVNSWNTASVTINGVNISNVYMASGSYPAKINGFWYISYTGNFAWSHFETK